MEYTAGALYGGYPSAQPTSTPTPDHGPNTPTPMARTTSATGGRSPVIGNPTMLLVVLVGAAIGLVHVSVNLGR